MEIFTRDTVDASEKFHAAEVSIFGDDMAAHRKDARRQCPYVKIVDGTDAVHPAQFFSKADDVDVRGSSLEQDIDCVPDQNPGTPQDQDGHDDADCRIGCLMAADDDRQTRDNGADRTDRVAQDMKERAPDIQAVMMVPE